MGGGVLFTVFINVRLAQDFFSLDEVMLYDGAKIKIKSKFPVRRWENGDWSPRIPIRGGHCHVRDTLYLVGGRVGPSEQDRSNWIWSVKFPSEASKFGTSDSDSLTWTGCGSMLVGRSSPKVVPLPDDDKIFICGGSRQPKGWVALYNIRTGEFVEKDVSHNMCKEQPNASFLWWKSDQTRTGNQHHQKEKPLIMVYYHRSPLAIDEDSSSQETDKYCFPPEIDEDCCPPEIDEDLHPQLFSYDMESDSWDPFCSNLPAPRPEFMLESRNLIYVGRDRLFIIDSFSLWFVYNLNLRELEGTVEVNGFDRELPVFHALYLDSSYNVDDGSTDSMTFCLFAPGVYEIFQGFCDIRYAKVRVQHNGEKYVAQLVSKATLKVGWYWDFSVFAGRTSRKRAAEEEEAASTGGLGVEED